MQILSCEQAKELYGGYFKGILSAPQKAALDAHISSCGVCRNYYEILTRLDTLISKTGPVSTTKVRLRDNPSGRGEPSPPKKRGAIIGLSAFALASTTITTAVLTLLQVL